ncbi:MAG TPA: phosphoglycerate mutase family protein [Steroidobacteraceae bacterium]
MRRASHRAMAWLVAALAAGAMTAVVPAAVSAQQLVYLVRHAERADGGSMSAAAETDPLLSEVGKAAADRLAAMLAESGITAIFATEYRRTQDTGRPLASRLGLTVQTNPARDIAGLVARLRADHANGIVLVIGHSNSVPGVIKALGGPELTMADDEYGTLFVFVSATGALSRIRF